MSEPTTGTVGDGGWDNPAVQAAGVGPVTPQPLAPQGPAAPAPPAAPVAPGVPEAIEALTAPAAEPAAPPAPDQEQLGLQAVAGGAAATEVDPKALLRMIQAQQAQIDALLAEKRASVVPDVVKLSTALADHLQAKADANPAVHADPDWTWHPALEKAATLADVSAKVAGSDGQGAEHVARIAGDLGTFVSKHGRHFPALDYSYISDLVDEIKAEASKLAA